MGEKVTLIIGLSSFIGGLVTWYGASVKKQYASERDFNHLKRNYEGMTANVAALSDMLDEKLNQILLVTAKIETRQDIILSQTRTTKED